MVQIEIDRIEVGKRLRELRGERTLKQAASDLGVTDMAISLWERGERVPNDDMKLRIAHYYNKAVTDIFFVTK